MVPSGGKRRRGPTATGLGGQPGPGSAHPTPPPAATVRAGSPADAHDAAVLHAGQIAGGFLSFLGPAFLTRLYRRISLSPHSFLLVAEELGPAGHRTVLGFIAGTADVGRLYRSFVWNDGVGAALDAGVRLVRRWRSALETLRHGAGEHVGTGRGVELLAVAVDPAARGRGVGDSLVAAFLARVVDQGEAAAYVVVAADNAGAVRLYRRAGFGAATTVELHAGTPSLLMQWDLGPTGAATGETA